MSWPPSGRLAYRGGGLLPDWRARHPAGGGRKRLVVIEAVAGKVCPSVGEIVDRRGWREPHAQGDVAELDLGRPASQQPSGEKIPVPDTQYDTDFWRDVDDEGVGGQSGTR